MTKKTRFIINQSALTVLHKRHAPTTMPRQNLRPLRLSCIAAALSFPVACAFAVDTTMTQGGFTGLSITPNAHTLPWGRFEASYDSQLPGVLKDPSGHNFVGGFGLLPNLEISGRIAASNPLQNNCFTQVCGEARDLSAAAKVGIGLDANNKYRVAVGAADVGGNVNYFRTYYGVLTYNEGPIEVSGGLAKRSGQGINGSKSPLNGPFAGAAWQPLPLVRGHVEYADGNAWGGLRLFAPGQWLPEGWNASVGVNQRITKTSLTNKSWLSLGVSIPLYKVPNLPGSVARSPLPVLSVGQFPDPAYEARALPPSKSAVVAEPSAKAITSQVESARPQGEFTAAALGAVVAPKVLDSHLHALAAALKAKGLEDISIGRMPDNSIAVLGNNGTYKWNAVDALGAALGAVSRELGFAKAAYRLVLTQRQTPLVAVTGQTDCLMQWVNNLGETCAAGQLSTPGTGPLEPLYAGANWVVKGLQPGSKTLRLGISPVLRSNIATEVGVLDFSLGVNAGLTLPLWNGASVEWSRNIPLAKTNDYEAQGVFGRRRVLPATESLAFTQTVRVPLEQWLAPGNDAQASRWGLGGVTAQGTVGRVGGQFDGVHGAIRWEPGEGLHRLTGQGGIFRNAEFNNVNSNLANLRTAQPLLASYRYAVMPTRTYLEATGGQFMNNDRGFQLGLRQWFSDVAVNVYYKRTSFSNTGSRSFVGLEFSVPIGPRQDKSVSDFLQVGGTTRFAHSVETLVGGANFVTPGYGVMPPVTSIEATFNSDRSSLAYFEDNIRRIRDSAR